MYVCLGLGKEGGILSIPMSVGPDSQEPPFRMYSPWRCAHRMLCAGGGQPRNTGGIVGPLPERQNSRRPWSTEHRLPQNAIPRNHTHTAYQPPRSWQARKQGASWGHRHGARTLDKHQVTNTGRSRTRFRINTHSSSTASVLASPENKGGGGASSDHRHGTRSFEDH